MSRTQMSYTGHEFLLLVMMTSFPSVKTEKLAPIIGMTPAESRA